MIKLFTTLQQQAPRQQGAPSIQEQYGQYINDPVVANMAMQYGSSLATSGKAYVEQNVRTCNIFTLQRDFCAFLYT